MATERITRIEEIKSGQSIVLTDRENLKVSGVNDVMNFSDTIIELDTNMGMLTVKGEALKIISISTEQKSAELCGKITSLEYKKRREKKSFIAGILK